MAKSFVKETFNMQKNILNALALLASIGSAGALKCANKDEYMEVPESHLQRLSTRQDQTHAVDVYFHIASTNANKDLITDETVDAQACAHLTPRQ